MQNILDYEEADFEEIFGLHFEVVREVFGEKKIHELIPGGSKVPVTLKNKYVLLFLIYIYFFMYIFMWYNRLFLFTENNLLICTLTIY